jgi:hypothetical protein
LRVSQVAGRLRWVLFRAVSFISPAPSVTDAASIRWAALHLAVNVTLIAQHQQAAQMRYEIRRAVDRCIAVLDGPPERHPAGKCDNCGRPLLADADADIAECQCGLTAIGIRDRRRARAAAADQVATATEISATLAAIGITCAPGTITSWGTRGQLSRRPSGLYALSEVMELVRRRDERKANAR